MSEGEGEEGFSCIFDIYFFGIFTFDQSRVNHESTLRMIACIILLVLIIVSVSGVISGDVVQALIILKIIG